MYSLNADDCGNNSASGFAKSPLGKALGKVGSGSAAVIKALISLGEQEHLTVANTAKAALTTAVTTFAGSFLGGAPGLLVGFAIGSAVAYRKMKNSKTLKEVLESMTQEQKEQLASHLMKALSNTDVRDLTPDKLPSLISRQDIKDIAIKILTNFLIHKMGLKLNK